VKYNITQNEDILKISIRTRIIPYPVRIIREVPIKM